MINQNVLHRSEIWGPLYDDQRYKKIFYVQNFVETLSVKLCRKELDRTHITH